MGLEYILCEMAAVIVVNKRMDIDMVRGQKYLRMGKNIQNRLQLVLRSVFPSISQDCPDEWGPDEIEGWDSMAHLDLVMAVGEEFGVGACHYENVTALSDALIDLLAPGVNVLVKGSRSARMERVVEIIAEAY